MVLAYDGAVADPAGPFSGDSAGRGRRRRGTTPVQRHRSHRVVTQCVAHRGCGRGRFSTKWKKEVESLRKITSQVIDFWCALLFWIRKHKTWEDASSQRQGLWSRNSRTSVIITKPWRSEDEKDYINHCSQTCVHVIIIFKSQLKICLCD